jgi:TonB family protein
MIGTGFFVSSVFAIVAWLAPFEPAQMRIGAAPEIPINAVAGGEVLVELSVDRNGRVVAVTPLRTTPPFTDAVVTAVRNWTFDPAVEELPLGNPPTGRARTPVDSKVLVAAVYLSPALLAPTLGERPRNIGQASSECPLPLTTTTPLYPPMAFGAGVVLVEALVDAGGTVADVKVVRSAPPFDEAGTAAVRQWKFRPARVGGRQLPARVYVAVGFPVPVTGR